MVKDEYAISFALIQNLRLMKDILSEIIANKRFEVDLQKQAISIEQLQEGINEVPAARSMKQALASSDSGIIAEFKRRSPSKGWIKQEARPEEIVPSYVAAGASALSILTDEKFFGGSLKDIRTARPLVDVPIIRKDFIIDEYQLYQAKIVGADAVLLIAAALKQEKCQELAEQAQAANKAKTAFLSHMSHDMRTPMNAIIGFTGIAMKNNPSDEVKNCLEKIDESSEHLLSLINDILDLTSIESGKVNYNPVPADVKNITDSVLDITKGFLTNRDINFKIQREEAKIPNVLADPARLRDVLVNILSNAVKFTPDGGTITFEARCQEKGGDGYINMRYRISDTGIGMSEEFTKEVFEEFAQEDSDVRTQYHGVGLGMAIVKKYVDMMGGTISVQSKKHEGTTFTVDIPLEITDKECNKSDTGFSEKVNLTGVNVLLAEDNELNAEIATVQLEEFGMNVERAVDGKNAVEIFRNHPEGTFDVILMDIMMPEMNGYEAVKVIRAMNDRPDGKNIPIIAMTANSFAEDVQASLDAGMNAHLSKPIVIDEVIKTILRYVDTSTFGTRNK